MPGPARVYLIAFAGRSVLVIERGTMRPSETSSIATEASRTGDVKKVLATGGKREVPDTAGVTRRSSWCLTRTQSDSIRVREQRKALTTIHAAVESSCYIRLAMLPFQAPP